MKEVTVSSTDSAAKELFLALLCLGLRRAEKHVAELSLLGINTRINKNK